MAGERLDWIVALVVAVGALREEFAPPSVTLVPLGRSGDDQAGFE